MDRILDKPYPIIIFEGWCMGISPQSQDELKVSLNDLEEKHDKMESGENTSTKL